MSSNVSCSEEDACGGLTCSRDAITRNMLDETDETDETQSESWLEVKIDDSNPSLPQPLPLHHVIGPLRWLSQPFRYPICSFTTPDFPSPRVSTFYMATTSSLCIDIAERAQCLAEDACFATGDTFERISPRNGTGRGYFAHR